MQFESFRSGDDFPHSSAVRLLRSTAPTLMLLSTIHYIPPDYSVFNRTIQLGSIGILDAAQSPKIFSHG
jgi:hypothetical protein